ncbi:efflux RND transporter periplasmic adaptor subunit [Marinobacter sp. ELB17]|uniref:efflux RND transporter periplasmic adaptor subunit n=1 Tax=Marinobacter sp. ELB17 TaxID=270374 RepID=UPI0000F3B22B|nr:efflux RND transporter periplasmic adaptor subunit [Marinobacter sp. ELB17]EAZ98720.1 periplasmic component of efflux system [Marinobacter sp. ELB17]
MSFSRVLVVLIFVAVLAGGAFWAYRHFYAASNNTSDVTTTAVSRGDIDVLVSATGVLEPSNFVDVGAQVSGLLDVIHVRVGEQISKDQLLAEIDPTIYLARVDANRAQLKNQQAQLADRKAQLTLADIQFQRQTNLFREDATTRENLQIAEASLASAKAQLAMLQAQLEQTASTLRAEEANLDYARIYSTMEGTVVSITARQGQTLNTSQQAPVLMRIADLSNMKVRAQVSEADVGRLAPGDKVYFTTLGEPGKQIYGQLDYIEPTPEVINNVVLYNAFFSVPNEAGRLLPSMTAQVFFVVEQARDILRVPAATVVGGQVWLKQGSGELVERKIEVGISNRIYTEVRDGLADGDLVVTGGGPSRESASSGMGGRSR